MKILHTVQHYWPSVGGMQEVVKQLSERLAARGHEVWVATSSDPHRAALLHNGVRIASFDVSGSLVTGLHGDVAGYEAFLTENAFDVIVNFAAQQWATDVMLPLMPRLKAKKVFVPTGFSALFRPEYASYFEAMRGWMREYDANVFLSNAYRDIDFARQHGARGITVIPNGAAEEEFNAAPRGDIRARLGLPKRHFFILHVGSHTGLKGHQEAFEIFRAARIKNAALVIVANTHGDGGCAQACRRKTRLFPFTPDRLLQGKRFQAVELTRAETVAAYHAADLFLFPSNIECSPLVLFECMASRTPFLTTDVGNAAEIVGWSGGGAVLPTVQLTGGNVRAEIAASARLLEDVYAAPGRRQAMAAAGHAAWESRFTWGKLALEYERLYAQLTEERA